jgi:hypothetical protein
MSYSWDRQPGETPKSWEAFQVFLAAGATRTVSGVAKQLGKSHQMLDRWSQRFNWRARAGAYDNHLANKMLNAQEKQIEREAEKWAQRGSEHRERAWKIREALLDKAEQMLEWPLAKVESEDGKMVLHPARWDFGTVARLVDTADKVGRLAADMPTEIMGVLPRLLEAATARGVDVAALLNHTIEELERAGE